MTMLASLVFSLYISLPHGMAFSRSLTFISFKSSGTGSFNACSCKLVSGGPVKQRGPSACALDAQYWLLFPSDAFPDRSGRSCYWSKPVHGSASTRVLRLNEKPRSVR